MAMLAGSSGIWPAMWIRPLQDVACKRSQQPAEVVTRMVSTHAVVWAGVFTRQFAEVSAHRDVTVNGCMTSDCNLASTRANTLPIMP
jgi:hypothetical protein